MRRKVLFKKISEFFTTTLDYMHKNSKQIFWFVSFQENEARAKPYNVAIRDPPFYFSHRYMCLWLHYGYTYTIIAYLQTR